MIPTLPTELIAYIQKLAEDGEEPSERLRIRSRFERVSKLWYNMVDYFTHLIIIKTTDATRLSKKMSSSKMRDLLGAKSKSIYAEPCLFNTTAMHKLVGIFKWLNAVESVEIRAVNGFTDFTGTARSTAYSCNVLLFGLATLPNVQHFTISGGGKDHDRSYRTVSWTYLSADGWIVCVSASP